MKGVSERIRRILNRENIKTTFKPLKTLGKERSTKEQLKEIVYKVSCRTFHLHILKRVKEVGSLGGGGGGLKTSLERMGMSAPR